MSPRKWYAAVNWSHQPGQQGDAKVGWLSATFETPNGGLPSFEALKILVGTARDTVAEQKGLDRNDVNATITFFAEIS